MNFNRNEYAAEISKINEWMKNAPNQSKIKQIGTQLNYLLGLPNHETDPALRRRIYEVGMDLYHENMKAIANAKGGFMAKIMITADQVNFKHALEKMYGCGE